MTADILKKLEAELANGLNTEVQVVYLLAAIRKLIERDKLGDQYPQLKFHCDWALHSRLDRGAAQAIIKQFDDAHLHLRGNLALRDLPSVLRSELGQISKMTFFENELSQFLEAYFLPPLTLHRPDGWPHFLHLYIQVIEDIPLVLSVSSTKKQPGPNNRSHVSHVTVHCELGKETIKHMENEEILYRIIWTVHDQDGQYGEIFIINSFSAFPA